MPNQNYRKIPKVELHRHLDGSVRFDTIVDLSKKFNIDLGVSSLGQLEKKTKIKTPMRDLQTVLDCFWTTQKVLCNYDAIKRVTFENVEDAFHDGCKLAELRFAPTFISQGKNLANDEIIEGILDGVDQALKKFDIQIGLIHIVPRTLSLDENIAATDDVIKYKKGNHRSSDRLVGFDLADAENDTNPEDFKDLVEKCRSNGFGITIHSGEDTTSKHVQTSIELLGAQRIGHGIKVWGDREVLDLVKERNIHLEVCPTSNWLTNCVPSLEEHPIAKLYKEGVSISINSDDPHIMNIDLVNEYNVCQKHYDFGPADFNKINKDTLLHSFLDSDIKQSVHQKHFHST